jgi:ABC-type amino acid transport substrate-binding protein
VPIGVETDTNSDFYLLSAQGGKVRANVRHFLPFAEAMEALRAGQVGAVMGQRGQIEGALRRPGDARFRLMVPRLPAVFGREWTVGAAVKADSRDLGYAISDILDGNCSRP